MEELTPFQLRRGRWYKRDDLHTAAGGTNGAKLRACQHLIRRAVERGATRVVTAASVLSPQHAIVANTCAALGVPSVHIVGGTHPASAARHPSVASALEAGAVFEYIGVGYNPALQRAARERAAAIPGAYLLHYGITPAANATVDELRDFYQVGATQVKNMPADVDTVVIPFGSGNTAAGVLYGLAQYRPELLARVKLIGIGPDRRTWLSERMQMLDITTHPVCYEHHDLHGTGYARYADRMPATEDGITMHPTYEGKVVRYLNEQAPEWWTRRDGTTCLWIVGGPLGRP